MFEVSHRAVRLEELAVSNSYFWELSELELSFNYYNNWY